VYGIHGSMGALTDGHPENYAASACIAATTQINLSYSPGGTRFLEPTRVRPQRHVDRFIRFCRTRPGDASSQRTAQLQRKLRVKKHSSSTARPTVHRPIGRYRRSTRSKSMNASSNTTRHLLQVDFRMRTTHCLSKMGFRVKRWGQ